MNKFKIKIRTLTPIFSNGATNKAELRVAEIKSLMRGTFREFFCFKNLNDIKKKESELFGDMKSKSPIMFKYKNIDNSIYQYKASVAHKNRTCQSIYCNKELEFEVLINNDKSEFYIKLLFLSSIVGGIGKRARKGNGSFVITNVEVINECKDKKKLINLINDLKKSDFEGIYSKFNSSEDNYTIRKKDDKGMFFYNDEDELEMPYVTRVITVSISNLEVIRENISIITHERKGNQFMDDLNLNITYKKKFNLQNLAGSGIPRFASPVYVTFFEVSDTGERYMVIKVLNCDYEAKRLRISKDDYLKYMKKYINELKNMQKG